MTDQAKMLQEDLDIQKSLAEVRNTKGGKILVDTLLQEIIGAVQTISENNSTLTMQEFIALGAKIKVRHDMLGVLVGAEEQRDYFSELLKEELSKTQ